MRDLLPLVKLAGGMSHIGAASDALYGQMCHPNCWRCKWEAALAEARKRIESRVAFAPHNQQWVLKDIIGEAGDGFTSKSVEKRVRLQRGERPSQDKPKDPTIDDGFGSVWSLRCPMCGKLEMQVVRPGKVQCGNCG